MVPGLMQRIRAVFPSFALIAAPLNRKLKKSKPRTFDTITQNEPNALETLREKLVSAPVLVSSRGNEHLSHDTGSYDKYYVVSMQEPPDRTKRPSSFCSETLNTAEQNYDTTRQECLAVVWALLLSRLYLKGQKVTIRTYHGALN